MKDRLSHNGPCSHVSWKQDGRAANLLCIAPHPLQKCLRHQSVWATEIFPLVVHVPLHHWPDPRIYFSGSWVKGWTPITTELSDPQFEVFVVGVVGFWWIPLLRSDVREQSHFLICEYHIPHRDTKMCSVILKSLHCVTVWFMRSAIHQATLVLLALACWYMS